MNIIYSDLYDFCLHSEKSLLLATGNSFVRPHGKLVMGKGAAKLMNDRFCMFTPDKYFGQVILKTCGHLGEYNIIIMYPSPSQIYQQRFGEPFLENLDVGLFQTKFDFKNDSDLSLIKRSIDALSNIASSYRCIFLNYPGIGCGNLTEAKVNPLLKKLPDNVFIFKS